MLTKKCIRCYNLREDFKENRNTCNRCMEQALAYQKEYISRPEVRLRRKEKSRLLRKTDIRKEYDKAYLLKVKLYSPEKIKARSAVSTALKMNKLVKLPCDVCGELVVQAHHENYLEPLRVIWLCSVHHGGIHRG